VIDAEAGTVSYGRLACLGASTEALEAGIVAREAQPNEVQPYAPWFLASAVHAGLGTRALRTNLTDRTPGDRGWLA
jgi:hypothetical protein